MRFLLLFLLPSALLCGLSTPSLSFAQPCDRSLSYSLMPQPIAYTVPVFLANFRISPEMLNQWAHQSFNVVVVGDHARAAIIYLLSNGVFTQRLRTNQHPLPFKDHSIDVLIYDQVIGYQQPEARASTIEEMMRVLKRGGMAFIVDYSGYLYHKEDMEKAKTLFGKPIEQSVRMVGEAERIYPFRFLKIQRQEHDF